MLGWKEGEVKEAAIHQNELILIEYRKQHFWGDIFLRFLPFELLNNCSKLPVQALKKKKSQRMSTCHACTVEQEHRREIPWG